MADDNETNNTDVSKYPASKLQSRSGENRFREGDDLTSKTKFTFRDYLGKLLDESSNAYKPRPGEFNTETRDTYNNAGGALGADDSSRTPSTGKGNASIDLFSWKIPPGSTRKEYGFLDADPTGTPPADDPFNAVLDKNIKSNLPGELLRGIHPRNLIGGKRTPYGDKDIPTPKNAPVVQKKISSILTNNRFHPGTDSPYIQDSNFSNGMTTVQKKLGEYDVNAYQVRVEVLRRVGALLMLRGAGETTDEGSISEQIYNFANGVQMGTSVLPTVDLSINSVMQFINAEANKNQFAIGIPDTTLRLSEQWGDVDVENGGINKSEKDEFGNVYITGNTTSYGHLNTSNEPFDSALPMGMVVLCAEAMLKLFVVTLLLTFIPSESRGLPNPKNPIDLLKGRWASTHHLAGSTPGFVGFLGDALGQVGSWLKEILGIPNMRADATEALNLGIRLFYGLDPSVDSPLGAVPDMIAGEGAANILTAPGFYVVVMRNVLRDIIQVNESLENLGDIGFNTTSLMALGNVLMAIASSATWRFVVTMMTLGDIAMVARAGYVYHTPGSISPDEMPVGPRTRMIQSRGAGGMAWRHGTAPSLYMLPLSIHTAERNFLTTPRGGWKQNLLEGKESIVAHSGDADTGRFPTGFVSSVEQRLNAEFVPFYFHDLRTNEIISFHAFLQSLNETISSNYNSSEAMGRVEPVRIYRSTSRNLTLSFHVVSTNRENHAHAWYDINKLAHMLYPQFSKGTLLRSGDEKEFRMPFSQVQTASPLIRLRIGDLIHSNGSRFALARLFGAGDAGFAGSISGAGASDKTSAANMKAFDNKVTELNNAKIQRFSGQLMIAGSSVDKALENAKSGMDYPTKEDGLYHLYMGAAARATMPATSPLIPGDVVVATEACMLSDISSDSITTRDEDWTQKELSAAGSDSSPGIWKNRNSWSGERFVILGEMGGSDISLSSIGSAIWDTVKDTASEMLGLETGGGRTVAAYEKVIGDARDLPSALGDDNLDSSYYKRFSSTYFKQYKARLIKSDSATGVAVTHDHDLRLSLLIKKGGFPNGTSNFELDIAFMEGHARPLADGGEEPSTNTVAFESIPAGASAGSGGLAGIADSVKAAGPGLGGGLATDMTPLTMGGGGSSSPSQTEQATNLANFFGRDNPIIRSFNSTAGRGLAGFITNMSMNYSEATWDTSLIHDQRAPMSVQIDINFDVVHDIAPGLDADGYMRAPLWPVGAPSNNMVNADLARDGRGSFNAGQPGSEKPPKSATENLLERGTEAIKDLFS